MDRVVERKRIDRRLVIGGAIAIAALLIFAFLKLAPSAGSQTVAVDRVTISSVTTGVKGELAKAGLALVAIAVTHTAMAVEARPMKTVRRTLFNMATSFPRKIGGSFIKQGACQLICVSGAAGWRGSCCSLSDSCTK